MRNAGEFNRPSEPGRVRSTYRRTGSGARPRGGRIRYAHGGAVPRLEPFCGMAQAAPASRGRQAGEAADGEYLCDDRYVSGAAGPGNGPGGGSGGDGDGGDFGAERWLAEPPVGGRHADLWVLVCGGIAAAAAFAAAFVATGGVSGHPATPASTIPAVISQACPAPAPAPVPARSPAARQ